MICQAFRVSYDFDSKEYLNTLKIVKKSSEKYDIDQESTLLSLILSNLNLVNEDES